MKTQKNLQNLVQQTHSKMSSGNEKISMKIGSMPDSEKVMTEKDYEDQMSFVLKH